MHSAPEWLNFSMKYQTFPLSISISKSSAFQREYFEKNRRDFLDALVANLNSRFPDTTLLISFSVLDPQKLPGEADLPTYGNAELL